MKDTVPPETIRTIKDAVECKAIKKEDDVFLRYHDRTISYAELDKQSNIIANGFLNQGIGRGDHVGLFMYNSPEYVLSFISLAKIGAVATPIDTRFTGDTLSYVLSESDITAILLGPKTQNAYEDVRGDLSESITEYFVGEDLPGGQYRNFEQLRESRSSAPDITVVESDTASLTYLQQRPTEQPKGVLLPQFSYVNTGWEASQNLFDYSPDDRIFTTLPLYAILTFQVGVMGTLLAEAEFALADRFEPERFWEQINTHQATIFLYLSRMLSVLHNQDVEPSDGETTAEFAIGASPGFASDEELFRDFENRFGVTILEGYGKTQVATIGTYNRVGDRNLNNVGKPPSYAEVEIVDDKDWPVPTGERGEIVVRPTRPNTMMKGYYDDPERTVKECRNQWIHTGGIGYKDQEGYLYFVATEENSLYRGRIAGRISSLEIESVINSKAGVSDSAVVGIMNESGSEEIKAIIVPEDDADITPVSICQHCKRQLPYLKVPRYIEIRDEFPRSPSGKIRKQDLKEVDKNSVWDRESGYELSK